MPVADSVKNYKQLLGQLAAAHEKASTRLTNAEAKRSEVIAVQDRLVAETAKGVDRAVVDMANGVGPELTSGVLGIDVVEVRRLVKSDRR
jgi:MinD superfamily P-loop ATPase